MFSSIYKQCLLYYLGFYIVHLVVELHLYIDLTYRPGFLQIADLAIIIFILLKEIKVMKPFILLN